jgi:hypothetical protein
MDAEVDGGVLKMSRVRLFRVGAGRGGSTGELASAVEVVDNAGDTARFVDCVGRLPSPSSANAAGGGDEDSEDVV